MKSFFKKNLLFRFAILFFIISTTLSSYAQGGGLARAFLYCMKNVKWGHVTTNVTKVSKLCFQSKYKFNNLNHHEFKNFLITNNHFNKVNDGHDQSCDQYNKKSHIQKFIKAPGIEILSEIIEAHRNPVFIECDNCVIEGDSINNHEIIVGITSKMNVLAKEYGDFNEIQNHNVANVISFINTLNHNDVINFSHHHESRYDTQLGGLIDLSQANGIIRTGSEPHGGMEPSFIIDLNSPAMMTFVQKMERFHNVKTSHGKRMLNIIKEMNKQIPHTPYKDMTLGLMFRLAHSEDKNVAIPLSSSLGLKVADCRNHASLLNIASRHIGITSHYGYFKVSSPNSPSEDHAMVVAQIENPKTGEIEPYIFDSYFPIFNGKPLRLLKEGIDHTTDTSEFVTGVPALKEGTFAKITNDSLSYPAYKIPR